MDFRIVHYFDADREQVEDAMFEASLTPLLLRDMTLIREIELLEQRSDPRHVWRRVRYVPVPMIKRIGPKEIPPEWMAWTERSAFHRLAHEMEYENVPEIGAVADRMEQRGMVRFEQVGPRRTRRVITGVLRVKVPIVGRLAERIIYANAIPILEEEARVLAEYLKEKGA
jgi:hypothetical protein